MPRRHSSMSMPRRMRRGSFCAHRVGKRLWSWLDPVQTGHAPAGSAASVSSTNRAQRLGVERRAEEREVEGQLELVALPVEAGQAGRAGDVGLAEEQAGRVVGLRHPAPAPQDVVQLGPLGVHPLGLVVDPEVDRRVVAQLLVLDDHVADVDAEAGGAAVEPEALDPVELLDEVRVPPVEVRLLGDEVVQVPLAGRRRRSSRPARRTSSASCWGRRRRGRRAGHRRPTRTSRGGRRHGRSGSRGTTGAGRSSGSAPGPCSTRMFRSRRGRDQLVEVGQRAQGRVDVAVVGDVVAPVLVGRDGDRVQPDGVDAQPLQVVQVAGDAPQVADAVAVRVGERPGVDLVDDAVHPPWRDARPVPVLLAHRSPLSAARAIRSPCSLIDLRSRPLGPFARPARSLATLMRSPPRGPGRRRCRRG